MEDGFSDAVGGAVELSLAALLRQRLVKLVPFAAPAAGSELSIAVPAGAVWELLAIQAMLTTSAAVANRLPTLSLQSPDGNEFLRIPYSAVVAAAGVANIGFAQTGGPGRNIQTFDVEPLPLDLSLPAAFKIVTRTVAIDVADQWAAGFALVREWSETTVLSQARWLDRRLLSGSDFR